MQVLEFIEKTLLLTQDSMINLLLNQEASNLELIEENVALKTNEFTKDSFNNSILTVKNYGN